MSHFRSLLRGWLRAAACGVALAAFAAPALAEKIVFGFSASTAFANAFVAANEGLFKKHGLDVEMKLVPRNDLSAFTIRQMQALGKKEIDERVAKVWGRCASPRRRRRRRSPS